MTTKLQPGQIWTHPSGGQLLIIDGLEWPGRAGCPHAVILSGPEEGYPWLSRYTGATLGRMLEFEGFTLDRSAHLVVRRMPLPQV